ncbi:MAG: hypothetical protein NDI77_11485 [Geobacteraceae bacterium]|nr:hypothetical protein [Geobacteraceae bacterium]
MSDCELLEKCIFFNDKMANMPATAQVIKIKYCTGDSLGCARYVVCKALGREKVPADLFPNQLEKANEVIAKG